MISRQGNRPDEASGAWRGPLFIVGMSRSGTKLLRDLLNQHSRVGIPRVETQFLPRAIERLGLRPQFDDEDLSVLQEIVEESPFYWNVKKRARDFEAGRLLSELEVRSWITVTRRLIKGSLPGDKAVRIWGDKTPAYLAHLRLLHRAYPSARFIHLVRDPRDRSLSVRRTWGKDILRAAARWKKNVTRAHRFAENHAEVDLLELRYEDLLQTPEESMREVCEFLSVSFEKTMLSLDSAPEEHGDASGETEIVQDNIGKYRSGLTAEEVRRIEEIAWAGIRLFGYDVVEAEGARSMTDGERLTARIHDAYRVACFHLMEKGIVDGVRYLARLTRTDTWGRYGGG